jgi:hypothetical protein
MYLLPFSVVARTNYTRDLSKSRDNLSTRTMLVAFIIYPLHTDLLGYIFREKVDH